MATPPRKIYLPSGKNAKLGQALISLVESSLKYCLTLSIRLSMITVYLKPLNKKLILLEFTLAQNMESMRSPLNSLMDYLRPDALGLPIGEILELRSQNL